jgi:hypothetical protein
MRLQRQQTLGKFFVKPSSMKAAPPQQAGLAEAWGKSKGKKTGSKEKETDESAGETTFYYPVQY